MSKPVTLLISNVQLGNLRPKGLPLKFDGFGTLGHRLSESEELFRQPQQRIWIHLDPNFPGVIPVTASDPPSQGLIHQATEAWTNLLERLGELSACQLLLSTVYLATRWNQGQSNETFRETLALQLNQMLRDFTRQYPGVQTFPFHQLVQEFGENQVYDERFWLLSRTPYAYPFLKYWEARISERNEMLFRPPRKVLVLDLDQTLWGGTLDEDGPEGILLGTEGIGLGFRRFQEALLTLKQRGVLLAVVSKNDQHLVEETLREHPCQVLRPGDFVAVVANWQAKSSNLRTLCEELGLGPEAFVMIDDDPRERLEIRQALPEIATPDIPTDIADRMIWFLQRIVPKYFDLPFVTPEDEKRTERYRNRRQREGTRTAFENPDSYLKSLQIHLEIREAAPDELPRVHQLLERTHQFNLRATQHPFHVSDKEAQQVWIVDYRDIYGHEGVTGALTASQQDNLLRISAMAVSCRVLNKRIEHALLAKCLEQSDDMEIVVEYQATNRNHLVKTFLDSLPLSADHAGYRAKSSKAILDVLHKLVANVHHES